jgi:hypothetical protein
MRLRDKGAGFTVAILGYILLIQIINRPITGIGSTFVVSILLLHLAKKHLVLHNQ